MCGKAGGVLSYKKQTACIQHECKMKYFNFSFTQFKIYTHSMRVCACIPCACAFLQCTSGIDDLVFFVYFVTVLKVIRFEVFFLF